jgi:hypothetical protein
VGPRTVLHTVEKRTLLTIPGLELGPAAVQPVTGCYTELSRLLFDYLLTGKHPVEI